MNHFPKQLVSPVWLSAIVIFAALNGGCGSSDNGQDPFTGGSSGGSTSNPGTAGRTGAAGSAVSSGGQSTAAGGSATGGSSTGTGGSATGTSGGSFSAGGFVSGTAGSNTSAGGSAGQSFGFGGSGGRPFGSGGSGGRSFGTGGSAGHGGQSASAGSGSGGASSSTTTWTDIYTKFLTNDQYASNCNGSACHNPGKQKGYDFTSKANGYASVKNNTTQFVSELQSGGMPKGKPKMPAADLALIKAWVAAGAPDN